MREAHYLVRVYADASARHTVRDGEGTASWLEYNRTFRPGNALFVDGVCDRERDRGYLSDAEIDFVEAALREELAKGMHDLGRPDKVSRQREQLAGKWETRIGYPEEPSRAFFPWPGAAPVYRF